MSENSTFLTSSSVCQRYQIGRTTLWRWENGEPQNGFPRPLAISTRKRWRLSDLEAWEQSLQAANDSEAQAAAA